MTTVLLTSTSGPLSDDAARSVRELVALETERWGVPPLSEQPLLNLRDPRARVVHIMDTQGGDVTGYAQLDVSREGGSLELTARCADRTQCVGALLNEAELIAQDHDVVVRPWVHGDDPDVTRVLAQRGYVPARTLLVLSRDLSLADTQALATPVVPEGFVCRRFDPISDADSLLAANSDAFSWHPEQGRLTHHDLSMRMKEPWFTPDHLHVVTPVSESARIVGFVWLKAEPHSRSIELYVLGVTEAAQGQGVGRFLTELATVTALNQGYPRLHLYVEADNTRALALYTQHGFAPMERHVNFTQPTGELGHEPPS